MSRARRIVVLIVAFVLLAGANGLSYVFVMRANEEKSRVFEERFELSSALYGINLGVSILTRGMRGAVITGGEFQHNVFFAELELDRATRALEVFKAHNAPQNEIELLEQLIVRIAEMTDISERAVQLRSEGYIQEAINLAHSPELSALGLPIEVTTQNITALAYTRTQASIDDALFRTGFFGALIIVTVILLVLAGFLGLVWVGKTKKSWVEGLVVRILAGALVLSAVSSVFLVVFVTNMINDRGDVYEKRAALVSAIYNVQISSERLSRLFRMIAVKGNEPQYILYRSELAADRFGQALETFITQHAEDVDINALIDITGNVTSLRQMEEEIIQMRFAGYIDEAIYLSYGETYSVVGRPITDMTDELRNNVIARAAETVEGLVRYLGFLRVLLNVSVALLVITGLGMLFVKLRLVKKGVSPQEIPDSYIVARIKGATITTRLVASFSIIIAIFFAYAVIDRHFNSEIDNLQRHNAEFMTERAEIALTYHQEFTEMRRLLRASFMNTEWLETANDGVWRAYEQRVTASYTRMNELAERYIDSVRADQIFPEVPYDSRIHAITAITGYVNAIYTVYSQNFFLSGSMCFYHGNVLNYADAADIMLRTLHRFAAVNQSVVEENIASYRVWSNGITYTMLLTAGFLAIWLSYSMVKNFTGRIKAIQDRAALIAQGDFDAAMQTHATDEISKVFNNTVMEQRAKVDAAQENSQAKSKFLARMSHEIRTPLTAVLGIAEIQLHNPHMPLEIEEAFAKIYSSSNTLLGIVNDILDLSKIEAGKMELVLEKYETASLLSDIAQLNMAFLGSKRLDFVIDVDESIPDMLIGDELRIKQVLNNLLSNAFKYTEKGKITLKVFAKEGDRANRVNMVFVIQDTGRGMSQEQVDALFDEYTRFHEKEFRVETGTGLGMPITYSLVQLMGGAIGVKSQTNEGTTVTITLPQQIASIEMLGAEVAMQLKNFNSDTHFAAKRLSFKPEPMPYGRVLVVDDVDANIFVAKGLLGLYQIKVDSCTSGPAAIEKIENGEVYDIIFMDQLMPEMNGTEAVDIIRCMEYHHPIVALTANALVGQAEEFLRSGFDGFLSKPIQSAHLNAVLHKFIKDKHAPPETAFISEEQQDMDSFFNDYMQNSDIYEKLCRDFLKSGAEAIHGITAAVAQNDLKTAHRAAHTLKGLAGLINEPALAELAKETEAAFKAMTTPAALIDALGSETERVLAKLEQQYPPIADGGRANRADTPLNKDTARETFGKLEQLLLTGSFGALEMIDELVEIPQTADLILQIEDFDFNIALTTIANLRETLEL